MAERAEVKQEPFTDDMTPIEMYKRMFPHVSLNFYQQDLIEHEVTDAGAWKSTLEFWLGNDYRGQSVFKMLEYYRKQIEDRVSRNVQANVGRYIPDPNESRVNCGKCFDTKEVLHFPDPNSIEGSKYIPCPDCLEVEKH